MSNLFVLKALLISPEWTIRWIQTLTIFVYSYMLIRVESRVILHDMHISLTPELEARVKSKVDSGMYNNASEVIREALRFMDQNEKLLYLLKTERLRYEVAQGAMEAEQGNFSPRTVKDILDDMNS